MALTNQQRAAAAAKYPEIVAAVNRLASIAPATAPTSAPEWMTQWNARSQSNYDAAGPEILAAANTRRRASAPKGVVTLGPFPQAGPKQPTAPPKSAAELAAAFQAAKAAVQARGGARRIEPRLSPDELAANAAAAQDRRRAEQVARDQRKAFSREARTFKRMAGLGYRDGIMAMPMMSPRDQFEMEMARANTAHGQQMDVSRLGLDQQQLRELARQFDANTGLNRDQLNLNRELGTGEIDVRRQAAQAMAQNEAARIASQEKVGMSANDVAKLQVEMQRALGEQENKTRELLGMQGLKTNEAIAGMQTDAQKYGVDANYELGMSGLSNQLELGRGELGVQRDQVKNQFELGRGLQEVQRLQTENQLKGILAGQDTQKDLAQLADSFNREQLKQQGSQFDATMDFRGTQAEREHYYNKRDFQQGVQQSLNDFNLRKNAQEQNFQLNKGRLAQGDQELAMREQELQQKLRNSNVTDREKAAMIAFGDRPDLQARALAGDDLNKLASEMHSNLDRNTRMQILQVSGGDPAKIEQALRMTGLSGDALAKEYERMTGLSYLMWGDWSLINSGLSKFSNAWRDK